MEANEAPEKIYLYPSETAGEEYEDEWGDMPWGEGYVEYTRTDAFIEKACEYLYQYNRNIVKKHGAKAVLGCSEFTINVYDFRKHMKGE